MASLESAKPRRSWLLVVTMDDRRVDRAIESAADVLMLDLQDAVTADLKVAARERVVDWFQRGKPFGDKLVFVRSNNLFTPWGREDIAALAQLPVPGIVYPMARSAEELRVVHEMLVAAGSNAEIIAILETPQSILRLEDIARVKGVTTLLHGPGDLSVETGIAVTDTGETFRTTATLTVLVARAYGLWAINGTHVASIRDAELVRRYQINHRQLGFDGGTSYYLPHIAIINECFSPTAEEVDRARALVEAYEQNRASGRAALILNGEVVMVHQYEKAKRILRQAAVAV